MIQSDAVKLTCKLFSTFFLVAQFHFLYTQVTWRVSALYNQRSCNRRESERNKKKSMQLVCVFAMRQDSFLHSFSIFFIYFSHCSNWNWNERKKWKNEITKNRKHSLGNNRSVSLKFYEILMQHSIAASHRTIFTACARCKMTWKSSTDYRCLRWLYLLVTK